VAGEVPLLVYLPPCYSEADPGYPVVYLLHGLPYDERHWLDLGTVDWVESRMAAGDMPPMVVVMPYQPEPLFTSTDGGPGSYEQEFLEGLLPFVESQYRVDSERRGLGGISRGGIWALEIAFHDPGSIAALAALSPALAVNSPRPAYDPFELASSATTLPGHILLLAGDRDWAATGTERLSQLLAGRAIQHKFTLVPGDHSDPTWSGALGEVFNFLSEALSQP
jgi:enterochelin esterase-like enzyme